VKVEKLEKRKKKEGNNGNAKEKLETALSKKNIYIGDGNKIWYINHGLFKAMHA
jgi:hypothetical protein